MSIFRSSRRSARAASRSEFERGRRAPGLLAFLPSPAKAGREPKPVGPEHLEVEALAGVAPEVLGPAQDEPFDVAIVATKGRWLDRRSLVVEVELTFPVALTLDQAAAMTESVEAAVLTAIPEARARGSGSASARLGAPWLSVSGEANSSTTTAAVAAGFEEDLTGG